MTASLKMRQLELKISNLQAQHQVLLKECQQEITVLLSTADLAHLDDKTLVGGLLFFFFFFTVQAPILEAWHDTGEKILRHHKPQSQHGSQHVELGNRATVMPPSLKIGRRPLSIFNQKKHSSQAE